MRAAINAWKAAAGLAAGPILRALQDPGGRRQDTIAPALRRRLPAEWVPSGAPPGLHCRMTDHNVARIFKRYARLAGLDPAVFSGHSARVGAAQDMAAAGFSIPQIMQAGRWKSERQLMRYIEHLVMGRGAAAMLAEKQRIGVGPGKS